MPEGDAVWRTARQLHDALVGSPLVRTDFRVPSLASADFSGAEVVEVRTRGKHLLTRLDTGLTVHSHLRMDGRWWTGRVGARHPGPVHDVRVVLATDRAVAVGIRVHDLAVISTSEEHGLVGHLGPDLLAEDWDVDAAARRLLAKPDRPIGEALLDQRIVAGLGTIYRAEALFLAGVSPWSSVIDVRDPRALMDLCRRLLWANRERPGIVTTGDLRRGRRLHVYDRAGEPCLRCRGPVHTAMQGSPPYDRVVYWCPRCQPERTPDAGPSVTRSVEESRGQGSLRPT